MTKQKFKALIRVVKSLQNDEHYSFGGVDVVREPIIEAENKDEVKKIMRDKYPQFFQNNKVYQRETKDQAQFFYLLIYPLYNFEKKMIEEGEWKCSSCGQVHENKYVSRPRMNERLYGENVMFCRSEDDVCINEYHKSIHEGVEFPDDDYHIKSDSLNYIYKCTEKATGKCYIGKTRNAPFFRWWNHLTNSGSPFGLYLRQTKLSEWTFEVLEELPHNMPNADVLKIESEYILKYKCIDNGFNSVISNKKAEDPNQPTLFNSQTLLKAAN